MDKKLELKLVEKYPKILRDYGGDVKQTCMAWGIDCQNGWYELLDKSMEKLQYFCNLCSKEGREVQVIANQIKEKLGTLRFYVSVEGANDTETAILDDIVSETERQSAHICEITGERAVLCHKGGWLKTLCREQARELSFLACNEETEKYWKMKDEQETIP